MTQPLGKGSAQGCSPAGLEEKVEDGPGASRWSPVTYSVKAWARGEEQGLAAGGGFCRA